MFLLEEKFRNIIILCLAHSRNSANIISSGNSKQYFDSNCTGGINTNDVCLVRANGL